MDSVAVVWCTSSGSHLLGDNNANEEGPQPSEKIHNESLG